MFSIAAGMRINTNYEKSEIPKDVKTIHLKSKLTIRGALIYINFKFGNF